MENWIYEFENLYIITYQPLYHHAKLLFHQESKIKEILILTYVEAYQRREQILKEKDPQEWLLKRMDFLAGSKMGITREELDASYAEERMQSKEAKKENWSSIDQTTLLLEIEEKIEIDETPEVSEKSSIIRTTLKGIFSLILFGIAILALILGMVRLQNKFKQINKPMIQPLANTEGADNQNQDFTEGDNEKLCIQVGDRAVYLSEIGEILYSLPIEESDLVYEKKENPEIQKQIGWTYYLPCPERKDSQLSEVAPHLYHTLYRMNMESRDIEIITHEVDDYAVHGTNIYVYQFGSVQHIDGSGIFEKEKPGFYAKIKDNDIYLYDNLGQTLETSSDGTIKIDDRIIKMSSNRILDVETPHVKRGQNSYYLKDTEDGAVICCSRNGKEEIFEKNGKNIDSFCIAENWLYYSTCVRMKHSGSNYSELYRKSLVTEEKAEKLGKRFTGRIYAMHYNKGNQQIYGEYVPKSWKNNHGVIAAISPMGNISILEDEELREGIETTGNDRLRFVMVQNNEVYCFWEDCYWEKYQDPVVIWRKPLVLKNSDRILQEN